MMTKNTAIETRPNVDLAKHKERQKIPALLVHTFRDYLSSSFTE
jgi:hypothetical protein